MHIWGAFVLHPLSIPIADQLAAVAGSGCKYFFLVCGAVVKPTVEDLIFIMNHLD